VLSEPQPGLPLQWMRADGRYVTEDVVAAGLVVEQPSTTSSMPPHLLSSNVQTLLLRALPRTTANFVESASSGNSDAGLPRLMFAELA
jgi:hypothetical protein